MHFFLFFSMGSSNFFYGIKYLSRSFPSRISCFSLILSVLLMYLFVVVGLFVVVLERIFLRWLFVDWICILFLSSISMTVFILLLRKLSIFGPLWVRWCCPITFYCVWTFWSPLDILIFENFGGVLCDVFSCIHLCPTVLVRMLLAFE